MSACEQKLFQVLSIAHRNPEPLTPASFMAFVSYWPASDRLALARALVAGDGFSVGRVPPALPERTWTGRMTASESFANGLGREEGWNACRAAFLASSGEDAK